MTDERMLQIMRFHMNQGDTELTYGHLCESKFKLVVNKIIEESNKEFGNRLEQQVSVQKAEIDLRINLMETLKDVYNSDEMVEMQTKIEIYFENMDSCLLNKCNYDSGISLLSD